MTAAHSELVWSLTWHCGALKATALLVQPGMRVLQRVFRRYLAGRPSVLRGCTSSPERAALFRCRDQTNRRASATLAARGLIRGSWFNTTARCLAAEVSGKLLPELAVERIQNDVIASLCQSFTFEEQETEAETASAKPSGPFRRPATIVWTCLDQQCAAANEARRCSHAGSSGHGGWLCFVSLCCRTHVVAAGGTHANMGHR